MFWVQQQYAVIIRRYRHCSCKQLGLYQGRSLAFKIRQNAFPAGAPPRPRWGAYDAPRLPSPYLCIVIILRGVVDVINVQNKIIFKKRFKALGLHSVRCCFTSKLFTMLIYSRAVFKVGVYGFKPTPKCWNFFSLYK